MFIFIESFWIQLLVNICSVNIVLRKNYEKYIAYEKNYFVGANVVEQPKLPISPQSLS